MKRMHVMLKVKDLQESVNFYTALFGASPTVRRENYAKWMLDDPRVNFSVAPGPDEAGIEHLGIQAETEAELEALRASIGRAEGTARYEGDTTCCYANSDKTWVADPQGVQWEAFYTYGESETYYAEEEAGADGASCCGPSCCGSGSATEEQQADEQPQPA